MYSTVYKPLAKFLFAEEFLKWQTGQTQKSIEVKQISSSCNV